jgi:hypothetical protein
VESNQGVKVNQMVVAPLLFGRRSLLRRALLRWCTVAELQARATVHGLIRKQAGKMRMFTLKLMEQTIAAIVDGDGRSFADSGELLRAKMADCR